MRTSLWRSLYLGAFLMAIGAAPSGAGVSADVNLSVGDRKPPAVLFTREPRMIVVPGTRVYYVQDVDYDMYRYGGYWYINDDGYWYRARTYRGPFRTVTYASVPRTIVRVPVAYHREPIRPRGHAYGLRGNKPAKHRGHQKQGHSGH